MSTTLSTAFTDRSGGLITVADLRAWLATLPPEFDQADVQSIVVGAASTAKRVVAYRYKDGSGLGIYVNSMGTHARDSFWSDIEVTAILH